MRKKARGEAVKLRRIPECTVGHLPMATVIMLISSSLPFSALRAACAMRSESSRGVPLADDSRESSLESHYSSSTAPSVVITTTSPADTRNFCAGTVTLPPEPIGGEDSTARDSLPPLFM